MKKSKFVSIIFSIFLVLGVSLFTCNDVYAGTDTLKVYNDNDSNITYSGSVFAENSSGNYASTYHGFYKGALGSTAKFNFTGNKLILSGLKCSSYTSKVSVNIDGIDYYFNPRTGSSYYQSELFSKTDLGEGEHSVVITNVQASPNPDTFDFRIDAVKIDSDDVLLPYYPSQKNAVLKIDPDGAVALNNDFTVKLSIDNVQGIGAEFAVIKYDTSKLQFLGVEQADGLKAYKIKSGNGQIEIGLKSRTENDYAYSKKLLAKLKFKALSGDYALINVESGSISNLDNNVRKLTKGECGHIYINISK